MTERVMLPLDRLVADAMMLADPTAYAHRGAVWDTEGGRPCPVGWDGCSQPVFVDRVTGAHDYGDSGGPGRQWCIDHCKHRMVPPPEEEEPEVHRASHFFTASEKETGHG